MEEIWISWRGSCVVVVWAGRLHNRRQGGQTYGVDWAGPSWHGEAWDGMGWCNGTSPDGMALSRTSQPGELDRLDGGVMPSEVKDDSTPFSKVPRLDNECSGSITYPT